MNRPIRFSLLALLTILIGLRRGLAEPADNPDDPKLAGHFSGRVLGPDKQPLIGARVYVAEFASQPTGWETTPQPGPGKIRASTDASGRFQFDAPDMTLTDLDGLPTRKRCVVMAAADGYAVDWAMTRGRTRSSTIENPTPSTGLELQLAKDDVPLTGQLLDADGRPLAGARVRLHDLMIPKEGKLDDYLKREINASPFGCSSGDEKSMWQVWLLPGVQTDARTDAEGRFQMTGLGRDRLVSLVISAPTVTNTYTSVVTRRMPDVMVRTGGEKNAILGIGQPLHGAGFTLPLQRGRTVRGIVRDRDTHQAIAGMRVFYVRGGIDQLPAMTEGSHYTVSGADGRFTITGLYPAPEKPPTQDIEREYLTAISPPGMTYRTAKVEIKSGADAVVETSHGIPFRLETVDDQGRPVEGEVTYHQIYPGRRIAESLPPGKLVFWPIGPAAAKGAGVYEGFAMPGAGVITVKAPSRSDVVPPHIDPKPFFAPDRTDWTPEERSSAYGTTEVLIGNNLAIYQSEYAAIVLVNPPENLPLLRLKAVVATSKPRMVSLVDAEGKPVVGATTEGMTAYPYDYEPPLRAAMLPLLGLHPERWRQITFFDEQRSLIGQVAARGDGTSPYTVRMLPWATVTGRVVDGEENPRKDATLVNARASSDEALDPTVGKISPVKTDEDGRFRINKLVPGLKYSAAIYVEAGKFTGTAFENLTVKPGEVRDLGTIHLSPPQLALLQR